MTRIIRLFRFTQGAVFLQNKYSMPAATDFAPGIAGGRYMRFSVWPGDTLKSEAGTGLISTE